MFDFTAAAGRAMNEAIDGGLMRGLMSFQRKPREMTEEQRTRVEEIDEELAVLVQAMKPMKRWIREMKRRKRVLEGESRDLRFEPPAPWEPVTWSRPKYGPLVAAQLQRIGCPTCGKPAPEGLVSGEGLCDICFAEGLI